MYKNNSTVIKLNDNTKDCQNISEEFDNITEHI